MHSSVTHALGAEMEEDFTKKSDDQLVAIIAVPPNNAAHRAAATELHRRQKEYESKNLVLQSKNISLQKWIFRITLIAAIIAAITLIVVLLQFFQRPIRIPSKDQQSYHSHPAKQPNNEFRPSKALEPLKEMRGRERDTSRNF